MARRRNRDDGAAAVEFALLLVPLLVLVLGIISVGRAYFELVTLTNSAREGARTMAIKKDVDAAKAQAVQAAPGLAIDASNVDVNTATCPPDTDVTVTVAKPFTFWFFVGAQTLTLTGQGVMRCGG